MKAEIRLGNGRLLEYFSNEGKGDFFFEEVGFFCFPEVFVLTVLLSVICNKRVGRGAVFSIFIGLIRVAKIATLANN